MTGNGADWDAATYDRVATPQARWGEAVLERLELRGDERVLDAGCGSGRVTEQLLTRLPQGRVVAVDASAAMLAEARRRLAPHLDRVELVQADLARPLPVAGHVDAVLSTATFHWVLDHDALFRSLAAALRPGGQLVAQCGGQGNLASVMRLIDEQMPGTPRTRVYASAADTERRLHAAGFDEVRVWCHEEPTRFEPGEPFEAFLSTVVLRPVLPGLPESERAGFVHRVATLLPEPVLDYVRLNITARRAV